MNAVPSTCRATVTALTDLLEAELGGDEAALAHAHLAACARCREVLAGLRAVPGVVAALTRAPEPADLATRILASVHAARGRRR